MKYAVCFFFFFNKKQTPRTSPSWQWGLHSLLILDGDYLAD